eukprot:358386-Chlamydomonas_euryale.AAC.3
MPDIRRRDTRPETLSFAGDGGQRERKGDKEIESGRQRVSEGRERSTERDTERAVERSSEGVSEAPYRALRSGLCVADRAVCAECAWLGMRNSSLKNAARRATREATRRSSQAARLGKGSVLRGRATSSRLQVGIRPGFLSEARAPNAPAPPAQRGAETARVGNALCRLRAIGCEHALRNCQRGCCGCRAARRAVGQRAACGRVSEARNRRTSVGALCALDTRLMRNSHCGFTNDRACLRRLRCRAPLILE